MFYSDDEGACWSEAPQRLYPEPDNQSGFQEPGVVELSDGAVMQWCRTDCGCQYKAFSRNGGLSWSPVVPARSFPARSRHCPSSAVPTTVTFMPFGTIIIRTGGSIFWSRACSGLPGYRPQPGRWTNLARTPDSRKRPRQRICLHRHVVPGPFAAAGLLLRQRRQRRQHAAGFLHSENHPPSMDGK